MVTGDSRLEVGSMLSVDAREEEQGEVSSSKSTGAGQELIVDG